MVVVALVAAVQGVAPAAVLAQGAVVAVTVAITVVAVAAALVLE